MICTSKLNLTTSKTYLKTKGARKRHTQNTGNSKYLTENNTRHRTMEYRSAKKLMYISSLKINLSKMKVK